jgi:calcineurin-like phosphoesterase family protein
MWWFTADEHYGHANILKYQAASRPFSQVEEMDDAIIANHNSLVQPGDTVVHCGDFSFYDAEKTYRLIRALTGDHIFVKGCHDRWMRGRYKWLWQKRLDDVYVACSHYPMLSWPRRFHGSFHTYGHVHNHMTHPDPMAWNVGVDVNNLKPVPLYRIQEKIRKNLQKEGD